MMGTVYNIHAIPCTTTPCSRRLHLRLKVGYTLCKVEIEPDGGQEAAEEAVETESHERWCIDMRKSTHKTR